MNIIQRELREATSDYKQARGCLRFANESSTSARLKSEAMSFHNRSRARLMNVIRATNVILGRAA